MLRKYSRTLFAGTFVVALLALLMVSLEVYSAIAFSSTPDSLWGLAILAIYFLIMSGYLLAFLMSYFLFTYKIQRSKRMLANSLLFIASYVFLAFVMGSDNATLDPGLLVLGIASVVLSDVFADYFSKTINKGGGGHS